MTALTAEQLAVLEQLGAAPTVAVGPVPRERRRLDLLAVVRRPSRVAQLERLLDRHRWANAGLRDRLRELEDDRADLLGALADVIDEQARTLGHAHPVVVRVRAILEEARR
jgi:hypothetical protein